MNSYEKRLLTTCICNGFEFHQHLQDDDVVKIGDVEFSLARLNAIVEELNCLIQKEEPTEPKYSREHSTVCPTCNRFIDRHEQKHGNIDMPRCKWCGQRIKWD